MTTNGAVRLSACAAEQTSDILARHMRNSTATGQPAVQEVRVAGWQEMRKVCKVVQSQTLKVKLALDVLPPR